MSVVGPRTDITRNCKIVRFIAYTNINWVMVLSYIFYCANIAQLSFLHCVLRYVKKYDFKNGWNSMVCVFTLKFVQWQTYMYNSLFLVFDIFTHMAIGYIFGIVTQFTNSSCISNNIMMIVIDDVNIMKHANYKPLCHFYRPLFELNRIHCPCI